MARRRFISRAGVVPQRFFLLHALERFSLAVEYLENGQKLCDLQKVLNAARQGYNLIHWTQSGMTYWLVSDLNFAELSECARLLKE